MVFWSEVCGARKLPVAKERVDSVCSFLPALQNLFEYGSYRQANEKSPKTGLGMRIMKLPDCKVSFCCKGKILSVLKCDCKEPAELSAWLTKLLAKTVRWTEVLLHYVLCLQPQYFVCPTVTVTYSYLYLILISSIIPDFSKESLSWKYDASLLN